MGKHVVIIGNGISGITAARHIRKLSDNKITVISAETDYFFSRTALMYIYMGHMQFEHTKPYENSFWKKNRIELLRAFVSSIDTKHKQLNLDNGATLQYDELVIATGSKPNMFGWKGQDLKGVQGLYSYQDLELMEKNTRGIGGAVIVGGGLIGIEMAEMLRSRNIDVTFLVRETSFWDNVLPAGESRLINRHILEHGVDLRLSTELDEIQGDENGRVTAVKDSKGQLIPCQFVGLTAGVSPNIAFLDGSGIELDRGVLIDRFLRTNIEGVYAIGDCAQHRDPLPNRAAVEQVWYTGRKMGETVAQTICGHESQYQPSHWFNSAKFFEIEFQTYGVVKNSLPEDESEFYWEDTGGRKCVHFVFDSSSRQLKGINSMGIRLRHEVFDQWLNEGMEIDFVIKNLGRANFDPEFFKRHEGEIRDAWQRAASSTEKMVQ